MKLLQKLLRKFAISDAVRVVQTLMTIIVAFLALLFSMIIIPSEQSPSQKLLYLLICYVALGVIYVAALYIIPPSSELPFSFCLPGKYLNPPPEVPVPNHKIPIMIPEETGGVFLKQHTDADGQKSLYLVTVSFFQKIIPDNICHKYLGSPILVFRRPIDRIRIPEVDIRYRVSNREDRLFARGQEFITLGASKDDQLLIHSYAFYDPDDSLACICSHENYLDCGLCEDMRKYVTYSSMRIIVEVQLSGSSFIERYAITCIPNISGIDCSVSLIK